MGDDCRHISRIVVHVMAVADLCRAAMPAPVMCDHAVTPFDKVQHLRVPVVRAQWPAVMENDRLPGTPVLVEDLDAVFCGEDRKSTRLNSSHSQISYAVFCLKKKKKKNTKNAHSRQNNPLTNPRTLTFLAHNHCYLSPCLTQPARSTAYHVPSTPHRFSQLHV